MRFIIVVIFTNTFQKILALLSLYYILVKINNNGLWRSKKLIVIHRKNILLFNIKALI